MADTAFEPEENAIPLRRSTGLRGMRTGPLRVLGPRRATSLPLAVIVMLAAAGSAAAFITVQPPAQVAEEAPVAELASLPADTQEPIREETPVAAAPTEEAIAAVDNAPMPEAAPVPEIAPEPNPAEPKAAEPAQAGQAAFGLESLPVLEADETSLGIDDALDALSAPITPQAKPAQRRSAAPTVGRIARNTAPAR